MKKLNLILVLLFLIGSMSIQAQSYYQVTSERPLGGNPYYILPKTTILLEIPVETVIYEAASQLNKDYSSEVLDILKKKYGVDSMVYCELKKGGFKKYLLSNDSIKVTVMAKPDYKKVFFTDGQKKWNKNKSITFTYGADGIISEGESSSEDKTFDIVLKSLSTIASIVLSPRGANISKETSNVKFDDMDEILTKLDDLGENMINYDIYKDVKSKFEKKYMKLFESHFYKASRELKVYKVYYTPGTPPPNNAYFGIFSFDKITGKLTFSDKLKDELLGVDLSIGDITYKAPYKIKYVDVIESLQATLSSVNFPSDGFAYNIPAKKELKLVDGKDENVYDDFIKIAQWGTVGRIATNKNKLSFSLDPLTGELKKITLSSTAVTTDQVGSVSSTVSDSVKLIRGDSDDEKLDKEVKRLDNEIKKRDLLKKLAEL